MSTPSKRLREDQPPPSPSLSYLSATDIPSIPASSPSYFKGPFTFYNREYFIIAFKTTPEALRRALPQPLQPVGDNIVLYEFMNMPDSPGLGSYSESGILIPGIFNGREVNYTAQMYLNSEPAIYAGREIWGFPKKRGHPTLHAVEDTLVGSLVINGSQVALGTMPYKAEAILPKHDHNPEAVALVTKKLTKPQINLKIIPAVDGSDDIRQLIEYHPKVIRVREAWKGPARLDLRHHVEADVADFPVLEVVGGTHMLADIILPYGSVIHDYRKDEEAKMHGIASIAPSIPLASPSYDGKAKHLFYHREHFVVSCRTTKAAIASALPSPLKADGDTILISFMSMKDSPGFGSYTETSVRIPCIFNGQKMSFVNQVYSNSSASQYGGRELWGLPMKRGDTTVKAEEDTLIGRLTYGKIEVALATMPYKCSALMAKHEHNKQREAELIEQFSSPRVSLKIMPDVNGTTARRQLVTYTPSIIKVHEAWTGPARIHLVPHVNAPIADFPILECLQATHFVCDMALPLGGVIYDYLTEA